MTHTSAPESDAAAQRFARFNKRPEIKSTIERYADWGTQGQDCIIRVQLSGLAMLRLAGRISRHDYRTSVRKLASRSGLPPMDFQLIAECSRELARYMLSSSGQIPFTPKQWDNEEKSL